MGSLTQKDFNEQYNQEITSIDMKKAVSTEHAIEMGTMCKHISIKQCLASEHKTQKKNYPRLLDFSNALQNATTKTVETALRQESWKNWCETIPELKTWIGL